MKACPPHQGLVLHFVHIRLPSAIGVGTDATFQGQCFPLQMQTREKEEKKIILDLSPKEQLPPELALVKKTYFLK